MNAPATLSTPDIRMMQRLTAWLWLLLGALVAATLLMLISRSAYFSLQAIVVEGDTAHHNALTLRANVAPRLHGNFFSVDLPAAKSVFESLPWVRRAVVKREFPNKLRVVLQEHQAVGLWGSNSESQLINSQGEVFDANPGDVDVENMPQFVGPSEQSALMLQMYQQMSALLKPYELAIEQLELSARGNWQATLDSGTVIEFGRGDIAQVLQRTQVFLSTVTQAAGQWGRRLQRDIESVDLRHSNGYAIKLKGVGTVAAKTTSASK